MILVITDYSLENIKGGGPALSVHNLFNSIKHDHEILIKYGDIQSSPRTDKLTIFKLINKALKCSVIYSNSLFSLYSGIYPLLIALIFRKKIIIAPRGELLKGKLAKKNLKKRVFLKLFKHLYNNELIKFHFTSVEEKNDSLKVLKLKNYFVASNLTDTIIPQSSNRKSKKIIWFSRISREKRLDLAIDIVKNITINLDFHFYGPIEDQSYFNEINKIIVRHSNIKYLGEISRQNLSKTLHDYDIFLFPTVGENFGHVIVEALQNGLYVLTSDKVPFYFDEKMNCGKNIPINNLEEFRKEIFNYYLPNKINSISWNKYLTQFYLNQKETIDIYKSHFNF